MNILNYSLPISVNQQGISRDKTIDDKFIVMHHYVLFKRQGLRNCLMELTRTKQMRCQSTVDL